MEEKSNEKELIIGSPKYNRLIVYLTIGRINFEYYCIGLTISTIRKELEISRVDMAKMIDINKDAYVSYELGLRNKNFKSTTYYKKFLEIVNMPNHCFDIRFFRLRKKKKSEFIKYIFGKMV